MPKSHNQNIKVACWNCRGLSASIPFLRTLLSSNDIVLVSEHWLHNNRLHQLNEVSSEFYTCARASRRSSEENFGLRRGQGGVAIFWRKNLRGITVIETIKHDRICGIRMEGMDNTIFIFLSVYMPASGSRDNFTVTIDELEAIIDNLEEGAVPIVCGDFNGSIGRKGGPRGIGAPNRAGVSIHNFMLRQNLIAANLTGSATGQLNTYEGHNGSSLIDYIMVPTFMKGSIVRCHTGQNEALNTSDHLPIEACIRLSTLPRTVTIGVAAERIRWDRCDMDLIVNEYQRPISRALVRVNETLDQDIVPKGDIDSCLDAITNILHETASVIPRSKFASHLKPYWNEELNLLKKDKMMWFNRWKVEGRTKESDDPVRVRMLASKKLFCKGLRRISRQYNDELIADAASKAEINHNDFWRLLKRTRGGNKVSTYTVRNQQGRVVVESGEILEVWRAHFDSISTPKDSENFDRAHFQHVTEHVKGLVQTEDVSIFLRDPISNFEVENAIKKLNNKKAPGYDGITAEHVKFAGMPIVQVICLLFNQCVRAEYVPLGLRKGIQVPLYKGKNACTLDCDNYRGITLLSTFNKLLEVIIWERLRGWWFRDRVVSDLQGAGRRGHSCIHTALTLQETISKEREGNKKVFVAYYDVSKAFDSVWIDGLFYQLHEMGITGSLWRLLYKMYVGFECCVRIGGEMSKWYGMDCGIHQGGYLSLVKYTAFINSLITTLEASNLCSTIYRINTSPIGYADDMAASTISKDRMDRVMTAVYEHGCKWRYSFNASKSAVLVFGENRAQRRVGSEARMFKLGTERVKERVYYDHVGIKTCVQGDTHVRTEEKVSKARKVLNMSTAIGIKRGGINISTCNIIYWSVVIPTLCFGCEAWLLKERDKVLLLAFQRYAARRIQRLHPRSLNATSTVCLGWMDIVNYVKARKVIFIRTIFCMEDHAPLKRVLLERVREYGVHDGNPYESPIIQILHICHEFDLLHQVQEMGIGRVYSKGEWKRLVWKKAWEIETSTINERMIDNQKLDIISIIGPQPSYSIWWTLSDNDQRFMRRCETMVKLTCHASLLKSDDCRLKRAPFGSKMCLLCNNAAYEDTRHMVMQCHAHEDSRREMMACIDGIRPLNGPESYGVLMGGSVLGWSFEEMTPIWQISCTYICKMYREVLNFHKIYH